MMFLWLRLRRMIASDLGRLGWVCIVVGVCGESVCLLRWMDGDVDLIAKDEKAGVGYVTLTMASSFESGAYDDAMRDFGLLLHLRPQTYDELMPDLISSLFSSSLSLCRAYALCLSCVLP